MENLEILKGYDGIFAKKLRTLMEGEGRSDGKKTTQEELAKAIGVTRQTISQYMDGSILPNIEKMYYIAKYFNVTSDYLIFGTESKKADNQEICSRLGLSDKTIEILENWNDEKKIYRVFLNFFFQNGLITALIEQFVASLNRLGMVRTNEGDFELAPEELLELYKSRIGRLVLKHLSQGFEYFMPFVDEHAKASATYDDLDTYAKKARRENNKNATQK